MIHQKPKNEIFASDAKAGEIVEFPNVKRGWGVTENLGFIPPMEYFNAAFNRVDKAIAYQLQRGVSEWSADEEYPIGALSVFDAKLYQAKTQNTNKKPSENQDEWEAIAGEKWSEKTFQKLTDAIDAYNKQESDERYAQKSDVTDATETKAGITKLKNSITGKAEDVAVTEKAVSEIKEQILGIGQEYKNLIGQRRANEIYTNDTGRPIYVNIGIKVNASGERNLKINGVIVDTAAMGAAPQHTNALLVKGIVPPGATYSVDGTVNFWFELR